MLMNPGLIHYSDAPPHPPLSHTPSNLVFLNNNNNFNPHAPPSHHTQQIVGIPLSAAAATSQDLNHRHHSMHPHHDVSAMHGFMPGMQYNLWNTIDPSSAARARSQQGLSLSLSSQHAGLGSSDREVWPQGQTPEMSGGGSPSAISGVTNGGASGIQSVLLSSKYLKVAHEVLDEVVNMNNGINIELAKKGGGGGNNVIEESSGGAASGDGGSIRGEGSVKHSSDLSTAQKQEIQMKKAKLISMLDEVEQRHIQYHHQIEIVVSSFEKAAGIGSARTYTVLALQTISKQFRCLKDAITGQIRVANKSLGEEDYFGGKIEGSRLKYVDHHLRQQRAQEQLGMIQNNAWRPQRGLPERSVSVLRAWLFEHFLHPYPKDSDKHMLAKQTGLTRSQVSNWFINARVRLWKPMVEEMYIEEMKENEHNGSKDKSSKINEDPSMKKIALQEKGHATKTEPKSFNLKQQGSPKKPRNHEIMHAPNNVPSINMDIKPNEQPSMKFGDERHVRDEYSFMGNQTNFIGGFGQYPIGDISRFDAEQFTPRFQGNGVSLTLGLDSIPRTHQTFLPNQNIQLGRSMDIISEQNEFGVINTSPSHSTVAYESINMQNPKRFAAQLLPDFVA